MTEKDAVELSGLVWRSKFTPLKTREKEELAYKVLTVAVASLVNISVT